MSRFLPSETIKRQVSHAFSATSLVFSFFDARKDQMITYAISTTDSLLFVLVGLCLQNGRPGEGWQHSECKFGVMGLSFAHVLCSDTH